MPIDIFVANSSHSHHSIAICEMISDAAKIRGTGIAKRDPAYISKKINQGHAVVAVDQQKAVGFCYIESWEDKKFVVNSGLIVHPDYRKTGLAKDIKQAIFQLSKEKYPTAKLFGITTSMAVMKINAELGYQPVTFSELTTDQAFWKGCESCTNFDILQRTNQKMCLCTGMMCDLNTIENSSTTQEKKRTWNNFQDFIKTRKERIKQKAAQFPKLYKLINND